MINVLSLILMLALCLVGCSKKSSDEQSLEKPSVAVSCVEAKPANIAKSIRVQGKLKATDSIAVYSKVQGKLVEYAVKNGYEVKKGDLIAYIDRDEVGYKYNQAPVYSPISGIISSLPLDLGSEIRLDTPIGYIVNIDHVNAVFTLPERYHSVVRVGQKSEVVIDSLDRSSYQFEVSEIDPLIDPISHSFTFKVKMENPNKKLIPGMFASGDIILETFEESILIPEEAIVALQGEWYIYKVATDQALLQKVKLGLRKEGRVQILEGVEPGDLVIVGGNHKVSDGQKVKNKIL